MAWLLRFDGVNDYLSYPSSVGNGIANAGDDNQHWELEFETTLDNPSNTYVYRPIESTTISRVELLFRKSDGLVRFVSPASGQYQWTGIDLSAPVIKMKLTKPLGVRELQVSINDGPAVSDTGGDNSCDFDVFGVNSSNGWLQGDLSYIKFTDFVTPANNLFSNAASSGGTGQILPDDTGTNDANLINFPTDNSQWISTGSQPLVIDVPLVSANTNVFEPNVQKQLLIQPELVSATAEVYNPTIAVQQILDIPQVQANTDVFDPTLLQQKVVQVPLITAETSVFNLSVLQPKIITLDDVIASRTEVYNPFIILGDGIMIPVGDRYNYNKLAAYLRTQGFRGNNNDVIMDWLFSEGIEVGHFNDRINKYLEGQGYLGALTDRRNQWRTDS